MDVLIWVGNREAVPVRAIPFVTGWDIAPDELARALAHDDRYPARRRLRAYSTKDGITCTALPRSQWVQVCHALTALQAELEDENEDEALGYARWQRRAPLLLPAGYFVWRDKFEAAADETPDDVDGDSEQRARTYSPLIPDRDLAKAVMEGFSARWFKKRLQRSRLSDAGSEGLDDRPYSPMNPKRRQSFDLVLEILERKARSLDKTFTPPARTVADDQAKLLVYMQELLVKLEWSGRGAATAIRRFADRSKLDCPSDKTLYGLLNQANER